MSFIDIHIKHNYTHDDKYTKTDKTIQDKTDAQTYKTHNI